MTVTPARYSGLDGLRGIAAVAVVLHHTRGFTGVELAPSSYLAVDLFYIISGFVISLAYEKRFAGGMSAKGFMVGRLVRLYPLFFVGICLGILSYVLQVIVSPLTLNEDLIAIVLLNLLFLPTLGRLGGGGDEFPI